MTDAPPPPRDDAAFELVTVLPGFASMHKRSGELDGNLPVRAARYCGPVFEVTRPACRYRSHNR